ncbi:hypothetical protein ACQPZZ_21225 [Microbispora sp. CA-135349]|uniref:hypothetical protein n=1 Tax=Microbispora sp. CA-135349 TaxID=3239953 RepID=UPI003D8F11E0
MLSLRELTRYLRGNRAQMGAFYIGQRVVVGDKCGEVDDIHPLRPCTSGIRAVVARAS